MKKTKKIIAAKMIAAVAVASVATLCVTGCSKDNSKNAKNDAASGLPKGYEKVVIEKDADGNVLDLGGMEIIIGDWWSGDDSEGGNPTSAIDAANREWHDWVEKTYNFNITQKEFGAGWDGHPTEIINYCMSGGDNTNYIFVIDSRSAITGLKSNFFYDLSKVKSVDWSKSKWNSGVRQMLTKGDSFYAVSPVRPEPRGGVFFNKRLLEEAGIEPNAPYDLQKAGKWTWDAFEEMLNKCTRDVNNDGILDTYGMANSSTEFVPLAAISNGVPMIGKNAEGKFINNVGDIAVQEALQWSAKMAANYEKPAEPDAQWDWVYAAFTNAEVAFQVDQEYNAQLTGRYQALKDDWGFVCFPTGPRGNGNYTTLTNDNMYVVPSFYDSERVEKIMKALDLWTNPTPGYDDPDAWKETYYPCFRDTRAVDETLQIMDSNPTPRYDTLIPNINYMGDVIWITYPGYTTPQEAYEQTRNNWQALLDEANNW